MNDGIQDNINANLVKSPAQSNGYLDMPILDDNSLSMRPPETQSVIHSIPDMSSQLPNIGYIRNSSQLSVPVVTTQSESENINGIYSRRPFHLQDKTSFLFSQPYFPGYYSPSLLNTDLSQSVHYDTPFKMLSLHQMGQRFPNYQNTIGLHPHGNTTTSSVTAAAHTIRHFASTGIGMNNQMHCPQQHTVNGNNPYGSGNYPIPNNMTSSIGGNPNYSSSHIGMNDNIMWPNQRNSIHTANSHYMGMDNNSLGNFHGNVTCSYPVSSTTRSENFLDSILSSEQTPKNFTQESDQGDYKVK